MTEHAPEFIALYQKTYGRAYAPQAPDFTKCAASVNSTPNERFPTYAQCSRQNGHGDHGAWCKQHDPEVKKAREAARLAKWNAQWDKSARQAEFVRACQSAVAAIAEGHNDAQGLCLSIIAIRAKL